MKHLLSLTAALTLSAALVACGQAPTEDRTATTSDTLAAPRAAALQHINEFKPDQLYQEQATFREEIASLQVAVWRRASDESCLAMVKSASGHDLGIWVKPNGLMPRMALARSIASACAEEQLYLGSVEPAEGELVSNQGAGVNLRWQKPARWSVWPDANTPTELFAFEVTVLSVDKELALVSLSRRVSQPL